MGHPLLCGSLLCLALALGGCQANLPPLPAWQSSEGRDNAELGQIHDLASGQVISPEQLVERLAHAPRVHGGDARAGLLRAVAPIAKTPLGGVNLRAKKDPAKCRVNNRD